MKAHAPTWSQSKDSRQQLKDDVMYAYNSLGRPISTDKYKRSDFEIGIINYASICVMRSIANDKK